MRKIKLMAATSAVALLAAGSAFAADPVEREGMSLVVYGQVNYMAMWGDSGSEDDFFVANNANSTSRFGFKATGQINDDLQLGANIEYGVEGAGFNDVTFSANEAGQGNALAIRHVYWWLKSASAGSLRVGHTDTATNGLGEIDLSGTGIADLGFSGWLLGDALTFGGNVGGVAVATVFPALDGNSRQNVVRYDTPSIGGFKLAASVTGDNDFDVAARYARSFGDVKLAAGIGYTDFSSGTNDDLVTGSAAIKHASGLSLGVNYADREANSGTDIEAIKIKLGYSANMNEYGPTHFAISYGETDNNAAGSADGETFGVFIVQDISHLGANFYAGYRNYETSTGADDVDVVFAGARVKF